MSDFSYLSDLAVSTDKTVEFSLHQMVVDGETPVLILAPATQANKPYFNALLKRAGKSARQVRAGNINAGMIDEGRDEDRDLFPKHVVKGWKHVPDSQGNDVAFSQDNCRAFLAALPDWLFDDIRSFATNPANFSDILDIETSAGN